MTTQGIRMTGESTTAPGTEVSPEPRSVTVLRERGVNFTVAPAVEGARDLPAFAARNGLSERQVIKSLLLSIERKDATEYALLAVAGDRSADFAALRRYFGSRSVRLADPETVLAVTGYRIGTVTPLALRTSNLSVLVDDALLKESLVSLGTGVPGRHVRFAGADLPAAVRGAAGPFAKCRDQ